MDGKSLNIKNGKIEKLKKLMPEVFTEGDKIDVEKLKLTLGEDVTIEDERYVLNWAGKGEAFKVLQRPTTATLTPNKKESIKFNKTENIFIEGENLEVLKVLQKSYFGKIKMIYIDPPYNTGNDSFIYPDRFSESKEDYLKRIGEKDEEGFMLKEGLFRKNSKDSGHYHSNWLSMMYPRLFLARNLLRDDGLIFVSIDDNEVHNLRMIMNEIFGEENFIDCIIWKKRYGGGAKEKYLVSLHEYILLYAKNINIIDPIFVPMNSESIKRYYKLKDEKYEIRGGYRTHPLEAGKSVGARKNLIFPITAPDGTLVYPQKQWLWSKDRTNEALKNNELEFLKDKNDKFTVHSKQYLQDEKGNIRESKVFSVIDDVYTQHGTKEIINLFGSLVFPFPKPSGLLNQLNQVGLISDNEDIVLDFFAGSSTTAHSILELNKQDGGNRKFILSQMPENTEENTEAFKAGYKTIADIGKERIRRVIKKIEEEKRNKPELFEDKELDLGFKVFKLKHSNFKLWRGDVIENEEELAEQIEVFENPVKEGAKEENVLYELMLKSGYELTSKVEKKNGYYLIADGELVIILPKVNESILKEVIKVKPKKCICLDSLFKNNDQLKTNTVLQMKDAGVEFKTV